MVYQHQGVKLLLRGVNHEEDDALAEVIIFQNADIRRNRLGASLLLHYTGLLSERTIKSDRV